VAGDSQFGKIILRALTTTNTAVVLTSDGAAAWTTNQLIVASNQAMTFFGTLIAKQSASNNMAAYKLSGAISNNAGTIALAAVTIEKIVDTIVLDAQPTFTADSTNKALAITSGYKTATSIRWVCNIDSVEVTYA
jgi:Kef-type K+ transport system membrane component KefB